MAGYRLTPKAREGFRDILEYLDKRFGAQVAERVLDRLVAAFEFLAERPGTGHRREDLTQDERVLFWSVGLTLIAYRPGSRDPVEILFVERAERDWERLLEEDNLWSDA